MIEKMKNVLDEGLINIVMVLSLASKEGRIYVRKTRNGKIRRRKGCYRPLCYSSCSSVTSQEYCVTI